MPRVARHFAQGHVYHVLNRGNGGRVVFETDKDFQAFITLVKRAKPRYHVAIFAYCIMSTHFHFVVSPDEIEDLSTWMHWLMSSHVRRYHRFHDTHGHIWEGRFKSFPIEKDIHLLRVLRYVEANPLRAGLVNSARSWTWSSLRESIGDRPRRMTIPAPVELPEDWETLVDRQMPQADLERIRACVNHQTPYGSPDFVARFKT